MRAPRAALPLVFLLLSLTGSASAQTWYASYEDGLAAARAGNWQVVVTKMTEAIKKQGKENNKLKSYGVIFINYHPYYYRGAAYLNLGKYEQAIDDLDKSTGPGEENLGSIEALHQRAEKGLKASAPAPSPAPPPVRETPREVPPPPVRETPRETPLPAPPVTQTVRPSSPTTPLPSIPAGDPQLESARAQANRLIEDAARRNQAARKARAQATAAADYQRGVSSLAAAQSRRGTARSAADWRSIADLASQASGSFDASITIAQSASDARETLPGKVTEDILSTQRSRIVEAVDSFYAGEYDQAVQKFETLSRENPRNPMIWAFLGASQYSEFYLNGNDDDPALRLKAEKSFKEAKKLKSNLELDSKYFSPRIKRFFKKSTS
ncbi:MAG TPA: tetratricopeptide repeat protein [Thermoanaerobaculia bacterium]|nr:tetratricopeptide repeat protein [Thermoanaerobaculia bacterium]